MELFQLKVACPKCGSRKVTYTCEPRCCFNHLCDDCYTTFELFTTVRDGQPAAIINSQGRERDSCAPTVGCVRCQSVDVFLVGSGEPPNDVAVCVSCQALLTVGVEMGG